MEGSRSLADGLPTLEVSVGPARALTVVVLHGYAMRPADLVPFARSMGVAGRFYFPEGPHAAEPSGHAWWPIDRRRRSEALARGARDLFAEHPDGAASARAKLGRLLSTLRARHPDEPLVLVGFSQGGMLASDTLLRGDVGVAGLVLLSSSRIALDEWLPRASRLERLPVLVSHGEYDTDLAFRAGEALRDFMLDAGADVTWLPFPGGHEIPLLVWRGVRRFLRAISSDAARPGP